MPGRRLAKTSRRADLARLLPERPEPAFCFHAAKPRNVAGNSGIQVVLAPVVGLLQDLELTFFAEGNQILSVCRLSNCAHRKGSRHDQGVSNNNASRSE